MRKVLVCGKVQGRIKYVISEDGEPFCEGSFSDSDFNIGDVFRGIAREHLAGTGSYFVDIGDDRTSYFESENVRTGEPVLVQIKTPAHDGKGALVTDEITFPGVYSVVTFSRKNKENSLSFSSKIHDKKLVLLFSSIVQNEAILDPLNEYSISLIVRTGVTENTVDLFLKEVKKLKDRFLKILNQEKFLNEIKPLYKTPFCEFILSKYRHFDFERVLTDDAFLEAEVKCFTGDLIPGSCEVARKTGHFSIFDIDEGASKVKRYTGRKVMLQSGAWITVDKTEAMHVFDVNSGSSKKSFLDLNKEAADAIMRVVKIKNLSGIIMCDFINMKSKEDNDELTEYLRKISENDYSFVKVYGLTKLGIMEISRKR